MRIFCVGCSFTEHWTGHWGDKGPKTSPPWTEPWPIGYTWPANLAKLYPQHQFYNIGLSGTGFIWHHLMIQFALTKLRADLVLYQTSSIYRWHMHVNYDLNLIEIRNMLNEHHFEELPNLKVLPGQAHDRFGLRAYSGQDQLMITDNKNRYDTQVDDYLAMLSSNKDYLSSYLSMIDKFNLPVKYFPIKWFSSLENNNVGRSGPFRITQEEYSGFGEMPDRIKDKYLDSTMHLNKLGNEMLTDYILSDEVRGILD